ncbi:phage tail tape measure protein, lambda family [Pseudomonas sp. GM49]|uniref:phage tail tape measure protein n=1 Tax=Pseudomonas sp. GM49 TaxID=1144331 RepID=UPI000270B158|nr:phage tail tape measure protein [Pseudomonas sp. GM49]EJM70443.1 phage tail tape measure protein, lambda family [Pseudomonas sp. GM49]
MANSLGTLTLDLIARIGGFTGPLDKAEVAARKSGKGIADSANMASLAWTALGEVVAGAVAGFSVGAVLTSFITETRDAEKEQAQLAAVLKSTGESAGFSRDQLNEMADAMEKATTFSGGDINQAQTALLAFTGVVGTQFTRALQAASDMAARTGTTVQQAAETIGRALDVPTDGLSSLSKQGFRFTEDQKKLAESLESVGDVAGAQGIILKALEESYGGAAAAARDTFGGSLDALRNTVAGLLTGEGGLGSARTVIEEVNSALGSPAARTALGLTAQAATALAVVLTTRLAASAAGTAIAFAAAQVEAVRYQLALARMAGVAPATAAGLVGIGVAARGASAAMALLGGPVGVVLLAASALAYFAMSGDDADESATSLTNKIDFLNKSFDGFTKNQAAAALQDINQDLMDAQLRAIDAESAVSQYQRLLRDHPNDARQREWNESLITAQGELDTARQKVEAFGAQINVLNGILAAPVVVEQSKAFKDLAKTLDEQILLSGKKTNADKLAARIGAGLVTGLKEGEGELLVAKAKTLDASEAAIEAEKKSAAASKQAATAAATAATALTKRGEDAVTDYQRQIALINTSVDAQKKATEADKLRFELASGKLVGINATQQKRLEGLAAELDVLQKLKVANEESAKSAAFAANLRAENDTVRTGFDMDLAGAAMGEQTRDRMRQDLALQQDYNRQVADLQKQLNAGDITQSLYDTETEMLREALAERVLLQEDYYNRVDSLQNDGVTGFISGMATQAEASMDLYGTMQSVGAETFHNLTDAITEWAETGKLDAQGLAASFIQSVGHALLSYAAAQVAMAGLSAFSAMIGIPFVGPVVAPGAAIAATAAAGVMMTAVGSALDGQAHDGIDYVPADGTWNLKKGERVTTSQTSAKLDRTLERVSQGSNNNGPSAAPVINLIEDASRAGQVNRRQLGEQDVIDICVANIRGEKELHQVNQEKYGLQSQGA